MTVTYKDLKVIKNQLGQFMTPDQISQDIVDKSDYKGTIIEPSFGRGSFLYKLEDQYTNVIGIEYDPDLFKQYKGSAKVFNQSFYTFDLSSVEDEEVHFTGNPPYRTPAYSLTSEDKARVKELIKKYNLGGVKEEAVFFLAHTIDIMLQSNKKGTINYILPKTIFENTSKAFTKVREFLKTYAPITKINDILENYPDVAQPLVFAKFSVNLKVDKDLTDSLVLGNIITHSKIFKRTYLGSVPCESLFLSIGDEPVESFKERLCNIFIKNLGIKEQLKYNGRYHLRVLNKNNSEAKFEILQKYVDEIKSFFNVNEFKDSQYYKTIQHRNEQRWYFRHKGLTKVSFIYIINSNPGKSFYFPGNPTKTSTDYFGFCDYDCNRNSSPGANRCVLIDNIEDNITEQFKTYWKANTHEPISKIFDYILYISKSTWYKHYKSLHQRFYFSLPNEFDRSWNKQSNSKTPIEFNNSNSFDKFFDYG